MTENNKPKFTPGPWYYDETDGHVRSANALGSAPRHGNVADPHADDIDVSEREANAHLIAASPALYEALEPLAAWAENERRRHRASGEENEALYMGKLADDARTALRLARGEA